MVYFSNISYTKIEADNRYAKLSAPNVFAGQNTFNQRITSYKGFQTSNGNADILAMNNNNEKKANVVYKQTVTGFKNWCHMQYLWTNDDSNYTNLLTFTFKPDSSNNNNIVEFTTALGSFSFNNKEIKDVANPTTNTSVANKQYVDSRVAFVEKNNINFNRQPINTTSGQQVTKYYSNSIPYADIADGCTGVISVACSDIPVSGEHLVITYFPKRLGNNVVIEIYQYNSNTNITNNLHSANFQFVIQKSI